MTKTYPIIIFFLLFSLQCSKDTQDGQENSATRNPGTQPPGTSGSGNQTSIPRSDDFIDQLPQMDACPYQESYSDLQECFVDSVDGDDSNNGLLESSPVKNQAAIPTQCQVVRYKRSSIFLEPVDTGGFSSTSRVVFTNYGDPLKPLPQFITRETVMSSFGGGVIIDGLRMEGSTADEGAMGDGGGSGNMGVCVFLGGDSKLVNSEITDCAMGIMLMGENSLVQCNKVFDLFKMVEDSEDTDVYANAVGGAEGIFVNGSHNEVAYNHFINCKVEAAWQGEGGYDGGATEVHVRENTEVTGLKIHHNFSYNSCGFFEVSGFGRFTNSYFYNNVSINSAWAMLLQVNETTLENIVWENNTFVHQEGSYMPSIAMIYRADLTPGTVIFNNNLVVFENTPMYMATLDPAIDASNNLIIDYDPGFVNIKGSLPSDFDLTTGSPCIDQGTETLITEFDFLNRPIPSGAAPDIGAFEYQQ